MVAEHLDDGSGLTEAGFFLRFAVLWSAGQVRGPRKLPIRVT